MGSFVFFDKSRTGLAETIFLMQIKG